MLQKIKRTQEDLLTSSTCWYIIQGSISNIRKPLRREYSWLTSSSRRSQPRFIQCLATNNFFPSPRKCSLNFRHRDVVEKIDKFKKYTHNSMQKMTANLSNRNSPFKTNLSKISYETDAQERELRKKTTKTKPIWKKSKNSKMSSETSMVMTDWLLRNF